MRNPKKIAIIVGVILLATIATLVYLVLWTGSTKEIEAIADKFQPGESWTLVNERIEPPRMVCLGDVACPSISRTWNSQEMISREQYTKMIPKEYNVKITGNCPEILSETPPTQASCHAFGATDGYTVNISYSIDSQLENKYRLIINIRKEA